MNNLYEEELEIDLLDLLGRMIAKWRKIVLFGVIGLVVGIVVSMIFGYVSYKNSDKEAKKLSISKKIAEIEKKLLEDEKGEDLKVNAENNLTNYNNITALYEMQKDYLDNSIYHKLDANNVVKSSLTYYIDNHYVNEYPVVNTYNNIGDITNAYIIALTSDSVCKEIKDVLGINTEDKYIKELVYCYVSSTSNIVINIVAENEEMSSKLTDYYKNKMPEITKEISKNFSDVDCVLQNSQTVTESDMNIRVNQNAEENKLLEYYKNLKEIENSMSGDQLDYFEAIQSKYNIENVKKEQKTYSYMHYVSKKMIVIVCILFIFLACAYYGALYLLDGKIKTGDELSSISNSFLLGTILVSGELKKKSNTIFDKWAISLTDNRTLCEEPEVIKSAIITSIKELMFKNNYKNIVLVGADIKHDNLVKEIGDKAVNDNKIYCLIDKVLDSNAISSISEADACIVVGEVNITKRAELKRVIDTCRLYDKKTIGVVAIQEAI